MVAHDRQVSEQELIQALEAIVGKEHVTRGDAALPEGVDGVIPRVAVFPADAIEIGAVLAYANERRLAVLPVGGGTQLGLGHPPERGDIALFLTRLDQIVAYEPADMTVTVQAGMSTAALQGRLACFGQCLPYDPPLPGRATIGGIIATREAGPLRQMFRGVSDRLLGIHVVTAEGKLVKAGGRVVKNVSGYEMGRLYTGSMGTLAVIVEATFKVQPRFEAAEALVVALPDLSFAERAIRALLDSDAEPVMLELIGPVEAGDSSPGDLVRKLAASHVPVRTPSAAQGGLLIAGYAGTPEEVAWQLGEAERIVQVVASGNVLRERVAWELAHEVALRSHRSDAERVITIAGNESRSGANAPDSDASPPGSAVDTPSSVASPPGSAVDTPSSVTSPPASAVDAPSSAQRDPADTSPGASPAFGISPEKDAVITCRAHVRASEVPRFIAAALALVGDKTGMSYAAHAGTGVVRLHLVEVDGEGLATTITALREQSVEAGGFLIIEQAPPEFKRKASVYGSPRQDFFLHKGIKERMDPNRILNPGRFIGNL